MDKTILHRVISFFGRNSKSKIDEATEINNDLEIIGDDAYFMLIDFEKKFNVSLKGISFEDYFLPELLFKYTYYKWFSPDKLRKKPLTIGHMAKVVEKGYWFEPQ